MPNFSANQTGVQLSPCASGSAPARNFSSSASLPGFACRRTNNASFVMAFLRSANPARMSQLPARFRAECPSLPWRKQLLGIGEERGRTTGVPEDDRLVCAELPAPDEIDEPGHGAARVDGIEEDTLVAGHELDRLPLPLAQHGVAAAEVCVVCDQLPRRHGRLEADARGQPRGDFRDRGLELRASALDGDAGKLRLEAERLGAHAQPGLGPEGAAREYDPIDAEPQLIELALQFLQRSDEACRTDLIGRADRDEKGPVTFGLLRRHYVFGHLLKHALAGEDDPCAEKM